jgi:hypothetical protein
MPAVILDACGTINVPIVSTPEVMRQWALATRPTPAALAGVLQAIEQFANYHPGRGAAGYKWWVTSLGGVAGW